VIPVLNEERALPGCIRTLHAFLSDSFLYPWRITVVDNGSTDATWQVATSLAEEFSAVFAHRLDIRGRGAALRAAWLSSPADIVAYMDVDLSTGLGALLPLVAPLATGHSGIAIGTRLGHGSRIHRSLKREVISRCYNLMLRHAMGARFSDAQCGFKAGRAEVVRPILDKVLDDGFFFDTELLLLAEYNGLRVHEVPVDWVEDADSRVRVWHTMCADIKGFFRVAHAASSGRAGVSLPPLPELRPTHPDAVVVKNRIETLAKMALFAVFGMVSTVVYTGLYSMLRSQWDPALANLVALAVTSIANTEANRRWTFNTADGKRIRQHYRAGLLFGLYYAATTGAVIGLHCWIPDVRRTAEIGVIVAVSAVMTVLRFIALDRWAFGRPRAGRLLRQ
jgi:putative flippase GtrA